MGLAHPLVGQHVVPAALTGAGTDRGRTARRQRVVHGDLLLEGARGGGHLVEDLLAEPHRRVHAGVDDGAHVLAHHHRDRGHGPQALGEHREVVLVGDDARARVVGHADRLAGGHDLPAHTGAVVDLEVLHRRGAHPERFGQHERVSLADHSPDRHGDPGRLTQGRDSAAHRGEVTLAPLGIARCARAAARILLVHEVSSLVRCSTPTAVGAAPPPRSVGPLSVRHFAVVSATIRTWTG